MRAGADLIISKVSNGFVVTERVGLGYASVSEGVAIFNNAGDLAGHVQQHFTDDQKLVAVKS